MELDRAAFVELTSGLPGAALDSLSHLSIDDIARMAKQSQSSDVLLEQPADASSEEEFLQLLESNMNAYCDDDPQAQKQIENFVNTADIEFNEPTTPEEALTRLADRAEREVSDFIEQTIPPQAIHLLNKEELAVLAEIYNPHNLLFFAQDVYLRNDCAFTTTQLDMIYRYRMVLRQIEERKQTLTDEEQAIAAINARPPKVGARTWGADIHPYGFNADGVIHTAEYRDFSEREDPGHRTITVEDAIIRLARGDGHGANIQL